MSPNMNAAMLMVASMVCFTVNDTFIKLTDGNLPLGQLLAIRGALASLLIIPLALYFGGLKLRLTGRQWTFISMRSVTEIGAAYFFLTALLNMPLANVSAILQVLPLTVTLGALLVFGEPIGWRRALAILVGFVGMLLIVRPGAEGFSSYSIYAVGAVCCVTARDLVTRGMPADIPSLTIATMNTITVGAFFAVVSIATPWQPISGELWGYILGSTLFIIGGYFFSVQVMRTGDISFVAPFRYSSLLAALILGFFVFGEWPEPLTILGAVIVVAAGLFTLWREQRALRRAAR